MAQSSPCCPTLLGSPLPQNLRGGQASLGRKLSVWKLAGFDGFCVFFFKGSTEGAARQSSPPSLQCPLLSFYRLEAALPPGQ